MCLIFTLLSSKTEVFAASHLSQKIISFNQLQRLIKSHQICEIQYNASKTAALVNVDCGSAHYLNFKNKKTHTIVEHWPSVFFTWISDGVAEVESSCGTGCTQAVIFIAPAIVISCASHDFRVKGLGKQEPSITSNRPLLIDAKKAIYICYDGNNNIQVFPFPKIPTVYPPSGYYADQAKLTQKHLMIHYENEKTGRRIRSRAIDMTSVNKN